MSHQQDISAVSQVSRLGVPTAAAPGRGPFKPPGSLHAAGRARGRGKPPEPRPLSLYPASFLFLLFRLALRQAPTFPLHQSERRRGCETRQRLAAGPGQWGRGGAPI